uniref:Uncharacterized protein LOC116950244 n=1 Tax=Petromyzon marinus TaxID=7757 RepID=A0AAJ7TUG7_PETMA|nr:uncharacterized protein LOC116950244 [Petromyzon marinus]
MPLIPYTHPQPPCCTRPASLLVNTARPNRGFGIQSTLPSACADRVVKATLPPHPCKSEMTTHGFLCSLVFATSVLLSVATPVWMGYYECGGAGSHSLHPSECASSPVHANATQYWSVLAKSENTLAASVNGPVGNECFPPECVNVASCFITLSGCYTVELKAEDKAWQFVPVTVDILPNNLALVGSTVDLVCLPSLNSTDHLQDHEPAHWERNGTFIQDQHHEGHVKLLVSPADSGEYICVLPGFRSQPVTLKVRTAKKILREETLKAVTGVLIFFSVLIVGGSIILCLRCRKPKPPAPLSNLADLETLAKENEQ